MVGRGRSRMGKDRRRSRRLTRSSAWVALVIVTLCPILPDVGEMTWWGPSTAEALAAKQRQNSVSSRVSPPFLHFVEAKRNGVDGVQGLGRAWAVAVSPDGKNVYAAGFKDSSVVAFSRDPETGKLCFLEMHKQGAGGADGIAGACSVSISPDGRHLYVAGHWDHSIAVFSRDKASGHLKFVEAQRQGVHGVDGLNVVQGVTVSPDGKHVYAAAYRSYAVSVFRREHSTGRLTFVEIQRDGSGGVAGLQGASSIHLSPDGVSLYAAGYVDSALAVFRRNKETGGLVFLEAKRDREEGVHGLRGPCALSVSPDGKSLYVASSTDSAVTVFRRDPLTGQLAFLEAHQNGVSGLDGLSATQSVVVGPDGKRVYAAGWGDNTLVAFARDDSTGKLAPLEVRRDGVGGVLGLRGPAGLAVSPDGKDIYAAASGDQGISVFRAD